MAALAPEFEAELDAIRADPGESVGFGEKAFTPYAPNIAHFLISSDDPEVTARLLAEATGPGDRVYRLAILQVLGRRTDATVDAALQTTLEDPELRATSAYLLGRPGLKEYPPRPRDTGAVLAALKPFLDDDSAFVDPFYRREFRTQDFVLGAFVRVAGPERFGLDETGLVGHGLPDFDDATRTRLLEQARDLLSDQP